MRTNLTRRTLAIALTATLLLAALPMEVQAQAGATTTFVVGTITLSPTDPITPDTGTAVASVPWTYNIATSGAELIGLATTSTTLTWDPPVCDNPNVLITGSLSEIIVIREGAAPPSNTKTGTSRFNIQVTQDAPGETPIRCTFKGRVEALQGTQVPRTPDSAGTVNVIAQYLGLLSANVPTTIKQGGPQKQLRYEIELSNLGNSRSTIEFALANDPPGKWNPVPPTQIVLESPAQGGQETTKMVSFLVSTPFKNGWNNADTTFQLVITPKSTKDPNKEGQQVTVNVLSRVKGVYVPTLEPLIMLGAVLGAGLVASRRMKNE